LALAGIFGAAAALGGKLMMTFAFGAMGGMVLLFAPIELVLGFFLALTFLIVGPLTSIAHITQATWAPYMISFVLLVRVPMEWYHTSKVMFRHGGPKRERISPVMWAVWCYFAIIVISVFANLPKPMQVLVGGKLYVFMWGLFFLLIVSSITPQTVERIWRGLLLVAILQLPFVIYQRLVEVPRRVGLGRGITALDAIVGTFTGSDGGGANGTLAMFCVFSIVLAISLWRNKMLNARVTILVVVSCLASIALGEVKVIIVLFPLAFVVFNRREILDRPFFFLGVGAIVVAVLVGIFTLYRDESANASKSNQGGSTLDHVEKSFNYILDPDNIRANGEVGRFAALNLWYRDGRRTPQTVLVGYAPGASQNSTTGRGDVASRYTPLNINSTTAAGMLWDIGVLGLAAFLALLIVAFFEALRLSNLAHIPAFHRSTLEASAVMMALVGVMVPYDSDVLTESGFQVLFLIALFQIVYWHSHKNLHS
jgi:hypothetical protein